jgi:hypothetical protein
VVKLAGWRRQAGRDVAQTLAVGELREGHHAKLFCAREHSGSMIATVAMHDALEGRPRQKIHRLSKQGLAGMSSSRHYPQKWRIPI